MWLSTASEGSNMAPVESTSLHVMEKLFVSKPVAIGYILVNNHCYENLKPENHRFFGEDCAE